MWCPALEKLTSASSQCAARIIFLLVLLSGVCLPFGDALRCVKCSSLHDSGCLEGIGFKQTCNASQKYCVSYTGYLRRGLSAAVNVVEPVNAGDHLDGRQGNESGATPTLQP
ncbi:uncharacterized protein LOC143024372 isoform X2 [Oratosquilla oratoria]|uniref:uncharacterized protein LOC143024372 isoform X2 n=1 Tax=Oratosquilla oratoria TaxID=337810 RepID=UPI003F777F01